MIGSDLTAQPRTESAITISSYERVPLEITINGRVYDAPRGEFSTSRLQPGNLRITIARPIGNHGRMQVVYRGQIFLPRAMHLITRLNRHNRLVVVDEQPIRRGRVHDGPYNPPHYDDGPHYTMVNVPSVINAMDRSSFESDKLLIAKQALRNNSIYSAGVERIARQLSFESSRLEFAKYAYESCVDPENYYRVNTVFSFSSSIRKLDEFINSYRGNRNHNNGY
jgi:hypothetical protein